MESKLRSLPFPQPHPDPLDPSDLYPASLQETVSKEWP